MDGDISCKEVHQTRCWYTYVFIDLDKDSLSQLTSRSYIFMIVNGIDIVPIANLHTSAVQYNYQFTH